MSISKHNSQVHYDELKESKFFAPSPTDEFTSINPRNLFPEIIGNSHCLVETLSLAAKLANSSSCVLILGESGTGKELIAAALHRLSTRNHKAFIAINCSAIPEDLLETELFGHEKGAFTGADRKRIGHFGAAHQGTLFLDEIGDMPLRLQAKLLRVLQEKKYTPIGSQTTKEADIRFIAATNKDLEEAVKQQTFRLDLYYRLNVLPITLPPLRSRRGDIGILVEHFMEILNRLNPQNPPCWIDPEAMLCMEKFNWPGNVRQLQNVVERLCVIKAGGRISKIDLPNEMVLPSGTLSEMIHQSQLNHADPNSLPHGITLPHHGIDLTAFVESVEERLINQALERTGFNKNQAAKLLGLNRTTLVERLKKKKWGPGPAQNCP